MWESLGAQTAVGASRQIGTRKINRKGRKRLQLPVKSKQSPQDGKETKQMEPFSRPFQQLFMSNCCGREAFSAVRGHRYPRLVTFAEASAAQGR